MVEYEDISTDNPIGDAGNSQTYRVITYEDAKLLAADAAQSALAQFGDTYDGDIKSVANESAEKAAQEVMDGMSSTYEERMQQVADMAADDVVVSVSKDVKALTERVDALAETARQSDLENQSEDVAQIVLLDETQWLYLQDSMKAQNTCDCLTLLIACMCAGIAITQYFVTGWRR